MDEVIQYRKEQKAGGGRLIYKGVKLNNRPMHNFRPTIGKHIFCHEATLELVLFICLSETQIKCNFTDNDQ